MKKADDISAKPLKQEESKVFQSGMKVSVNDASYENSSIWKVHQFFHFHFTEFVKNTLQCAFFHKFDPDMS